MPGIFHQENGSGPPLVLIHGFCETGRIWNTLVPKLSSKFRVICPDLPGFGNSQMLKAPFSIVDVAAEMSRWMAANALVKPVVIGHSLGGYVTLAIANKGEVPLAGFGLFHSTALADSDEKKVNRNKVIDFVARNGVAPYIETYVPGLFHDKESRHIDKVKEMLNEVTPEALTAYLAAMRERSDQSVLLARYPRPILLVAGKEDEVIPVESVEKLAKLPQKGTFTVLDETAHMGMLEAPEKSAREIVKFGLSCQF